MHRTLSAANGTVFALADGNLCFQTTDLDVTIYLHARGYPLLRIAPFGDSSVFTFPSEAALSAEAFYQDATVSAKAILHAARELDFMRTHKTYEYCNV